MKKIIPTLHSKARFSERIGYREDMKETLVKVKKYGIKLDDIPLDEKYVKIRCFMQRNKIYHDGKVYIFAGSNEYKILLTVYPIDDENLEKLFIKKEKIRVKQNYYQMFTQLNFKLYSIIFYKGKITEIKQTDIKKYRYQMLTDEKLLRYTPTHLSKLIKGKNSPIDIKLYYGNISELERDVYKRLLEIKKGETITYKELANEFEITIQRLSGIIKRCPFHILIPTHRVIKTNGQVGSYKFSKELKKDILNNENKYIKNCSNNIKKRSNNIKKRSTKYVEKEDYFSYSIGDLL